MALHASSVYAGAAVLLLQALGAAECAFFLEDVRNLQQRRAKARCTHEEPPAAPLALLEHHEFTPKELRELVKIVPSLSRYGRVFSGASLKVGWLLILFLNLVEGGKLRSIVMSESLALLQIAFAYPFVRITLFALKERPPERRLHRVQKKARQLFPFIAVSVWYIIGLQNALSGFTASLKDSYFDYFLFVLYVFFFWYFLCSFVYGLGYTYAVRKFLRQESPDRERRAFRLHKNRLWAALRLTQTAVEHIVIAFLAVLLIIQTGWTKQTEEEAVYYITATAAFLFARWAEGVWKDQTRKMARWFANDAVAGMGLERMDEGSGLSGGKSPGPEAVCNRRTLCWKPSI